jgi:hypothetical protein
MNWAKLFVDSAAPLADLPRIDALAGRLVPLALFIVLLAVLLTKAVRVWQEIHEVQEPTTKNELLAALEDAHAAGDLDDNEIAKVRRQLDGFEIGSEDVRRS